MTGAVHMIIYSYERHFIFVGDFFMKEAKVICNENVIDHLIADVSEDTLIDLAELFKVFGDSTRIKILYDLFGGEKHVTEICEDLGMNQSAVSHQLKILKTSKLIGSRRDGKSVCYSLADEHVKTIIAMGKEHIEE